MKTARKHAIGTTLATATDANHPQSPDHEGRPTMAGRAFKEPGMLGQTGRLGGGSLPNSKGFTPVKHPAVSRPNGGSFKPGRRSGGGKFQGS